MKDNPFVSIIVAVYNMEMYLGRCLESIISQTFTDFEVILIDDGSTDSSFLICEEYSRKDNRIFAYTKTNGGAYAARYFAMDKVSGIYINFIDPDDYVDPMYLEHLVGELDSTLGNGLISSSLRCVTKSGEYIESYQRDKMTVLSDDFKILFNDDIDITHHGFMCAKLYNRKLIVDNNINIDSKLQSRGDLIFMLNYLMYCDYVKLIPDLDYNYVRYTGSASKKFHSFASELKCFNALINNLQYYEKKFNFNIIDGKSFISKQSSFESALKSNYVSERNARMYDRIKNIKILMNSDNGATFLTKYNPEYFLDKVGRILLLSKLYFVYDIILKFMFFFRIPRVYGIQ